MYFLLTGRLNSRAAEPAVDILSPSRPSHSPEICGPRAMAAVIDYIVAAEWTVSRGIPPGAAMAEMTYSG